MPRGLVTHVVAACDFNPNAEKRRGAEKKGGQSADPPQTTLNNDAHVSIRELKKKKSGAKLKAAEVQHRSMRNTKKMPRLWHTQHFP